MKDIKEWYNRMVGIGEQDYPFISYKGIAFTPTQILAHAEANDELWQGLERMLDPEVTWDLLRERLLKRYEEGRLLPIYALGRMWTPEEIVEEARKGTPSGQEFMLMEKKIIEEMSK